MGEWGIKDLSTLKARLKNKKRWEIMDPILLHYVQSGSKRLFSAPHVSDFLEI